MTITIVIDNKKSWILPTGKKLLDVIKKLGHHARLVHRHEAVPRGDLAIYLGCEKIVKSETLVKNIHNIVVHESKLPQGRGMSPLTWQILEGKSKIPITVFEVSEGFDEGDIYLQKYIHFKGDELVDELRAKQASATIDLVLECVESYKNLRGKKQTGRPTYYKRRRPADSELDINKSIKSQFNLLRVVDNERYPAFFRYKNTTYILKINKASTNE